MMISQEEQINNTFFVVEATGYEYHALWREYTSNEYWKGSDDDWVQEPGFLQKIGEIGGFPVCVSVSFVLLEGKRIAFYHGISRIVDHTMVEEWVMKTFNPPKTYDDRRSHCDAMNFGHCIRAMRGAQ